MIETFMRRLLERIHQATSIAMVGAGKNGKLLHDRLCEEGIKIDYIMDNNVRGGTLPVQNLHEDGCLYLVTPNGKGRDEIYYQLLCLGIPLKNIVKCYFNREYQYMKELPLIYWKDEISDIYRGIFHREIDWERPKTYNEIICREKLFMNDSVKKDLPINMLFVIG